MYLDQTSKESTHQRQSFILKVIVYPGAAPLLRYTVLEKR